MPRIANQALPLQHWCVLSLRPRGQHAALRAAAARNGARTLALSPFAIEAIADAATSAALTQALRADLVLYTSPNTVAMAATQQSLRPHRGQCVLAVGSATQRALRALGVEALAPRRMDSEGLLAMPQLRDVGSQRIGLVTGTGGRGLIAPALQARGADVLRVDIYKRFPATIGTARWQALADALVKPERVVLTLSSAEALAAMLRQQPVELGPSLRKVAVIAASERLAQTAHKAGFRRIAIATDARPASLLRAAIDAFT